IRVRLNGSEGLAVTQDGDLLVPSQSGGLTFKAPDVYQVKRGRRVPIRGNYVLESSNEFRFQIGRYDKTLPLVIDPVLTYSTYLAGSNIDMGLSVAVDSAGSALLTGFTSSPDFPL